MQFAVLLVPAIISGSGIETPVPANAGFAHSWAHTGFDHGLWGLVRADHVDAAGLADYAALAGDTRFLQYLYRLANTNPAEVGNEKARLAFWISADNAVVIHGVIATLPTDRTKSGEFSVRDVEVADIDEPVAGVFRRAAVSDRRSAVYTGRDRARRAATTRGSDEIRREVLSNRRHDRAGSAYALRPGMWGDGSSETRPRDARGRPDRCAIGRYRPAVRQRPGAGGVGSPLAADVRFADLAMVRQGLCGSWFESEGGFDRRVSIPACEQCGAGEPAGRWRGR